MPPKAKFTKEQITEAALQIIRDGREERLTARTLGKKLGSSSCPIFTVFENMEEVQQSVIAAAKALYKTYVEKGLSQACAFRGVGMQYILFAVHEPYLFQLLFMNDRGNTTDFDSVLLVIDESYEKILLSVMTEYEVNKEIAENLYKHLWIYSHGIATLCATKMCRFTGEEINDLISQVFIGLLKQIEGEKEND